MVLRVFQSVGERSKTGGGGGITIITIQSQNKESIGLDRFEDLSGHFWILWEYCGVVRGIGGPLAPIRGGKPLLLPINSPWGAGVASIRHGKAI